MTEGKLIKYFKKRKINNVKNNSEMNVVIFPQKIIDPKKTLDSELNNYKYNDYEMNNLIYEEALKLDKRTYFQYYFSLLKRKQLLIFTFYTSTDYNSRYIKLCLFFFSFALYLTINTLFFANSAMHQIYQDKGSFSFLYNLPKIFYSTMISAVINIIITYLSLTEKDITKIRVKVIEEKQDLNFQALKLV